MIWLIECQAASKLMANAWSACLPNNRSGLLLILSTLCLQMYRPVLGDCDISELGLLLIMELYMM